MGARKSFGKASLTVLSKAASCGPRSTRSRFRWTSDPAELGDINRGVEPRFDGVDKRSKS